jgi:hypothetical protein
MDPGFLPREIHLAAVYPGIEPVKVFEDPDAGTAVYVWDAEGNHLMGVILKLQQALRDERVFQEIEFPLVCGGGFPWCPFQFVVVVQVVRLENFVDRFAAVATKGLLVVTNLF